MKKVLLVVLKVVIFLIIIVATGAMLWIQKDKTSNISNYNKYFGEEGKHNIEIFPRVIPSSAKVEEFCYYYYNILDPNYVSYLVYSCDEEDFKNEKERLTNLYSSKDKLIYGATGFNYPVYVVKADSYSGYIYALGDEENKKFIYVEIKFCNYFSDIKYEEIIDEKYLPINFDAKPSNLTRKEFKKNSN